MVNGDFPETGYAPNKEADAVARTGFRISLTAIGSPACERPGDVQETQKVD